MIIGLTGPNASGKGEAALYIKSKGFAYHSLSDILRKESKKLGIEPTRENLIELGNKLRSEFGPSVLAERVIERLSGEENHIIDSIRNPAEVAAFRKRGGFVLLGIDAPVEKRFKRSLERNRPGDAKTLYDFIEKEGRENKSDPESQQIRRCLSMSDAVIVNDANLEGLHRKIDEWIKKDKEA